MMKIEKPKPAAPPAAEWNAAPGAGAGRNEPPRRLLHPEDIDIDFQSIATVSRSGPIRVVHQFAILWEFTHPQA